MDATHARATHFKIEPGHGQKIVFRFHRGLRVTNLDEQRTVGAQVIKRRLDNAFDHGETIFASGVPFRAGSPDTGPGLSEAGERLVRRCNQLRILIDLSHLNEAGFWDVARISDSPLVATHSNAHALCQVTRNLTDRQLAAIRETDGLVGLNFGTGFLHPEGSWDADLPLDTLLRHLDYLLERLGETGVALGSDFDGATMPAEIGDAAGLPRLLDAMEEAGYGPELIERIAWRNWIDLLRRTWGQ